MELKQLPTYFEAVEATLEHSVDAITRLQGEKLYHERVWQAWNTESFNRVQKEQRRIAPGYLDAELRMLQPTRTPAADNSNKPNGRIDANLTQSNKDMQPPENEIDRAFGRIEI